MTTADPFTQCQAHHRAALQECYSTRYEPEARPVTPRKRGCAWAAGFVHWYNHAHRHSGIRYVSPAQRHAGEDHVILAARHPPWASTFSVLGARAVASGLLRRVLERLQRRSHFVLRHACHGRELGGKSL